MVARRGVQSVEFISLAYLYFALRDRLIFEFVTGRCGSVGFARRQTSLQMISCHSCNNTPPIIAEIKQWREDEEKLASNALSSLRDFGLLKGPLTTSRFSGPAVSPEAVFHLLCILVAEGRESASIIEAPDWRLFLLTQEIARALSDLAQKNWIRLKSGRVC